MVGKREAVSPVYPPELSQLNRHSLNETEIMASKRSDTPAIQVTDRFEQSDPNLSSLQRYAKLAREHDLIKHPIKVDRDEEDEMARIVVEANFGGQSFTFETVAKAVHFLALIYHVGEHAVENA